MPIGKFGMDETRLVKWMFTTVFVTPDGEKAVEGLIIHLKNNYKMKNIALLLLGLFLALPQFAQERKYSTFYEQRATLFEELPVTSRDIIFLGNSITNGCEWGELFQNTYVKNRGISGDICMGVYERLDPIIKGKPAKIFLLIGINDVARGTSADTIVARIEMIVKKIKAESPKTELYLQSVLPVNDCYGMWRTYLSLASCEADKRFAETFGREGEGYIYRFI